MKRILAAVLVGVLGLGLLATSAQTAPKPSPVPVQWELDIDVQAPKPIKVSVAGEAKPRLFWYMTYTVSNHSGADQVFVPEQAFAREQRPQAAIGQLEFVGDGHQQRLRLFAAPHGVARSVERPAEKPR